MAFIFTMSSPPPRPATTPANPQPRSILKPSQPRVMSGSPVAADDRLSVIMENGDAPPPPVPVKASHRPHYRRWQLGSPPSFRFESPPPPYVEVLGPHGEKLSDVRNNKHIARRGGWKRLCIIMFVLMIIVIALAVGLSVGLKKSRSRYVISVLRRADAFNADFYRFPVIPRTGILLRAHRPLSPRSLMVHSPWAPTPW